MGLAPTCKPLSPIVICCIMDKHTVSFRIDADKVTALDALAEALERDRSHLLNEAVSAYLEAQSWQVEQIKKSLRQANAGKLLPHARVKQMARKWR
jgi:predicted transcriptional regulator